MTRRTVIKGLAALIACTAFPAFADTQVGTIHILSDTELFQKVIDEGILENLTFNFDSPIYIQDINKLTIINCVFNFNFYPEERLITFNNCKNLNITNCTLKSKKMV